MGTLRFEGCFQQDAWLYTYYVTDATGNVIATYDRSFEPSANPSFDFKDKLVLSELHIFGSSRLGMLKPDAVKNRIRSSLKVTHSVLSLKV